MNLRATSHFIPMVLGGRYEISRKLFVPRRFYPRVRPFLSALRSGLICIRRTMWLKNARQSKNLYAFTHKKKERQRHLRSVHPLRTEKHVSCTRRSTADRFQLMCFPSDTQRARIERLLSSAREGNDSNDPAL